MKWYIGTSGWGYDQWKGKFYPTGIPANERLAFYARHFNAVEVNTTFYHLPSAQQIEKWENIVPNDFTLCIKAWRHITHVKKLNDPHTTLPLFIDRLALQKQPTPVIFQLSPYFHIHLERLSEFLKALPKARRYVLEFRHSSWHEESVYALLRDYGVAFCLFEKGELHSPRVVTSDFIYVRLHGRKENYQGNYSKRMLTEWYAWLSTQGKDVYIFFDNTNEEMFAIENALLFRQLVG